jgi:transcriptional regulator with XRE-family HTH domain
MITPQPEGQPGVQNMIASSGRGGPTALRILLGGQLRRLREAKQITLEDAGYAIRASGSKISRLETGRVGFKSRDIADLLTLYGVTNEHDRSALQELGRQASAVGWWHDYADVMPHWFEPYVGLGEAAASIRSYEIQFVPGLLQTADYARAVALLGHPARSADEAERRVSLRMARQAVLTRETPVHLWAVLDEAVLLRPIGGADVLRGQLEHLIEVSSRPNISLQLVPLQLGGHAAAGGPFSILRFGERDLPDLVYLEQLASALYLDKRETVNHYLVIMDRLCVAALSTSDSVNAIRAMLKGG